MKIAIACLFMLACTATLAQQSNEYLTLNDIQYKAPAGWKALPRNNDTQAFVSPNSTPENQAMIIIAQSEPISNGFHEAFDQAIQTTFNGMKIINQSEVKTDKTTDGNEILMKAVSAEGSAGNKLYTLFVAMNVHQRMSVISLAATSDALFAKYQQEMTRFIANVQFSDKSDRAVSSKTSNDNNTFTPSSSKNFLPKSAEEIGHDEDARRKPNIVAGNIYEAQGRPFKIPGAKVVVHIWGAGSNSDRVGFNLPMDANGHYESQVPSGLYGFDARAFMPLNGNIVSVGLEPLDGRPTNQAVHSAPGIVKDFQLKLTGPIAGGDLSAVQGYYGGAITVTDGDDWNNPIFGALTTKYPAGSKVILTLTPQSPLIDGSKGTVLTLECEIEKMNGDGIHRVNIPFAAYRVTAKLVTPNGKQQRMRVGALPNLNFTDAVNIYYEPDGTPDARPIIPNILVASYE